MFTFTMVGASFRPAEAKDVIRQLTIGDTVQLVADPDNEYDDSAVAIYADGQHIGFVPRDSNGPLFTRLVDDEETIEAEVIAFESTYKPVLEVQ